ncbi:MAG: hypothetical protein J6X30_05205 [Clostridia bacterium]|nr:hypothetical protein [Clostridia bacterium]
MEITLENVLTVLRKCFVRMLVAALVVGIGAYLVSRYMIAPTYVSTAKLNIVVPIEARENSVASSSSAWVYANRQVLTCVELLQSNSFAKIVRENAVIDHNASFKVTYNEDSTIITITASDNTPKEALKVALTAAEYANDFIAEKNDALLSVVIVDMPEEPRAQIAPHPLRNVALAAVAAAAIVFAIELLRETLGTKVKNENELARHYEYPVIAVIPDFNDAAHHSKNDYYYSSYAKKAEEDNGQE